MITIIGAGPTGNYLAYLLAKQNKEVQVYEDHEEIGSPVQCAGIITAEIEEFVTLKKEFVVNKINQARIYAPNGESILVKFQKEDIIVDRKVFDNHLADMAKKEGAKFHLKKRYESNENNKVKVNESTINTDILIGADGPLSRVAKNNDLWCERKFVNGNQVTMEIKCDKSLVQFWLGYGMFGWLVPVSDSIARIGVVSYDNPEIHLKKLIEKINPHGKIISREAGLIPLYNPKQKLKSGNVYLVGDAATQVKATSFGGIVHGLKAAKILAEDMDNYEKKCKKEVGKDLYLSLIIRKMMDKFSDEDYNELVKMFNKNKLKNILETKSRDYPSKFLLDIILKEPRILKFLPKLLI